MEDREQDIVEVNPEWDENTPIHILPNGFGIFPLVTLHDRNKHRKTCTLHCVNMRAWDASRFGFGLKLFTIRNENGKAEGIILTCDAAKCITYRAGDEYVPYITTVIDEFSHPVVFPDGTSHIVIEICPKDSLSHDRDFFDESSRLVRDWILTLPSPDGPLSEYRCNERYSRENAKEFLRQFPELKIAS